MRGGKPKPTHLKLIEGNRGRRPLNKREPKCVGDLCSPPDWFNQSQKDGWNYAISNAPKGMLKLLDRSTLTAWVIAEDLHRQATLAVTENGLVVSSPDKGVPMQNPYLAIINRQAVIMLKAASDLGFTPSSRSRVKVDVDDGEEDQDSKDYNLG